MAAPTPRLARSPPSEKIFLQVSVSGLCQEPPPTAVRAWSAGAESSSSLQQVKKRQLAGEVRGHLLEGSYVLAEASLHNGARKGLGGAVCIRGPWPQMPGTQVSMGTALSSFGHPTPLQALLPGAPVRWLSRPQDRARAKKGCQRGRDAHLDPGAGPEGGPRVKPGCGGGGFQGSLEGPPNQGLAAYWGGRTLSLCVTWQSPTGGGILAQGFGGGRLRSPGPHRPLSPHLPPQLSGCPSLHTSVIPLLQDGRHSPQQPSDCTTYWSPAWVQAHL